LNQEKHIVDIKQDLADRPIDRVLLTRMRGGPTRLRILQILNGDDKTCNEISCMIHVSWGAISQHLVKMRDAGLVAETRIGRIIYYRSTVSGQRAVHNLTDSMSSIPG